MKTELAPYAADDAQSRGRRHREDGAGHRSEYQRARDRTIHSAAFRRLEYKTLVFVNHAGDLLPTPLTPSVEVTQIPTPLPPRPRPHQTPLEAAWPPHQH